jgi:hypothetical protein
VLRGVKGRNGKGVDKFKVCVNTAWVSELRSHMTSRWLPGGMVTREVGMERGPGADEVRSRDGAAGPDADFSSLRRCVEFWSRKPKELSQSSVGKPAQTTRCFSEALLVEDRRLLGAIRETLAAES